MQAAQTCLNVDEMPNGLLPNNNKIGTVRPINSPAIDQCQGCLRNSMKYFSKFVQNYNQKNY